MEIAPRIGRVGRDMVNVYVIEDGGEVTIVDAGVSGYWSDLPAGLAALGRSIEDVRALLLTHAHSDHLGFAERLRTERRVPVSVHEADAAMARGEEKPSGQGAGPIAPLAMLRFLWFGARKGGLRVQHVGEVATFGDGATLDVPGAPRVIHVPGHSPGSAVLHFAGHDALLVGDAFATLAVTTGATGPRIAPFTSDPTEALASLARIEDVEARWALPGHGAPWTGGVAAAVAEVRRNAAEAAARSKRA